ncbi:FAD-dependent oxidoreductase [Arthrobacter sp. GCM10027362]|uniref:FAD-dependent oxidoreductase n=1 Tax=Arthrobacter sp. GCM10027362 TaxID=3273379 RepID=UPI0036407F41
MSKLIDSPPATAQIAIVGSGPSGCYAAQFLRKLCPTARIGLFERLPVPFGLVRYGVAPDHQGTKSVDRQFDRLFSRGDVDFFGNVEIGRDLSLEQLREMFDVVLLATGLAGDNVLDVPGADLAGVYGSGRVTRLFNEHPDEQDELPRFGSRITVVGNGNVALDVVRLLTKPAEAFAGSDLSEDTLRRLVPETVRHIDVVGRSAASNAKFNPVVMRELGKVPGVRFLVTHHQSGTPSEESSARASALEYLAALPSDNHRCTVHFHLGVRPLRLEGDGTVERLVVQATGREGSTTEFETDSVVTALGFGDDPGSPFSRDALAEDGADLAVGRLGRGLFCAGWFHRGPRGTIAENRAAVRTVAEGIAASLDAHAPTQKPGAAALPAVIQDCAVRYPQWQRIDAAERDAASPDRCRSKFRDRSAMIAVARGEHIHTPAYA